MADLLTEFLQVAAQVASNQDAQYGFMSNATPRIWLPVSGTIDPNVPPSMLNQLLRPAFMIQSKATGLKVIAPYGMPNPDLGQFVIPGLAALAIAGGVGAGWWLKGKS